MKFWNQIGLPLLLIVVFALSRWPGVMPDNFSAVYALVFCAGVFLPRKLAWWLPLAVMVVTDLLLNLHYRRVYAANPGGFDSEIAFFNVYQLANYASYGVLIWLGTHFKPSSHWLKLLGGGLLGALVFYVLSNTASWLQLPGYTKNLAGWIQALTVGLPAWQPTWTFLLKSLLSTGLFTGLFVGAMRLALREAPEPEPPEEAAESEDAQPEDSKA